jgi:ADP-ribose pyrophosphatase
MSTPSSGLTGLTPAAEYCGQAGVYRAPVTHRPWSTPDPAYQPVNFTRPKYRSTDPAVRPGFADHPDPNVITAQEWALREEENGGPILRDAQGFPLNPAGRTGIADRGLWGCFGANGAVDPAVTKWRRDATGGLVYNKKSQPVLQFLAVDREDDGKGSGRRQALPGGMKNKVIDPATGCVRKEAYFIALARELREETQAQPEQEGLGVDDPADTLQQLFKAGKRIYKGPVYRDPRNTDNAWGATEVTWIHDAAGTTFDAMPLKAGSDAKAAYWCDYDPAAPPALYADHDDYLGWIYTLAVKGL